MLEFAVLLFDLVLRLWHLVFFSDFYVLSVPTFFVGMISARSGVVSLFPLLSFLNSEF